MTPCLYAVDVICVLIVLFVGYFHVIFPVACTSSTSLSGAASREVPKLPLQPCSNFHLSDPSGWLGSPVSCRDGPLKKSVIWWTFLCLLICYEEKLRQQNCCNSEQQSYQSWLQKRAHCGAEGVAVEVSTTHRTGMLRGLEVARHWEQEKQ